MAKRLFALLCATCLLASMILGCGNAAPEDTTADFVGTWAIDEVTNGGDAVTGDELDLYKAMGVYLIAGSDHTVLFEMFGVSVTGTFQPEGSVATVTFSESEAADAGVSAKQTLEAKDDKLLLKDETDTMTFVQIDPSDKKTADVGALLGSVDESSLEETLGSLRRELESTANGTAPVEHAEGMDETVASDKNCVIKVLAKGTYQSEPSYLVEIENKGDQRIVVEATGMFSVSDASLKPVLFAVVEPRERAREVLWFDGEALGGGAEALGDVKGKLVVTNSQTGDEVASYDLEL